MIRILALSAILAASTATVAIARVDRVEAVEVTADVTAITNERAAAYWSNVAEDIQSAILARLVDRIDDDGARIIVDISEIELATSFERALDVADAVLVGRVTVDDPTDHSNSGAYELKLSMPSATVVNPDGTLAEPAPLETARVYRALVEGFAAGVVERLD
jgi:hypothetical protein